MKKYSFNEKTTLTAIFYIPAIIFVVLFTIVSCSSTKTVDGSDKEIVDFSHSSQFRKKGTPLVKPLFMSSERADFEFPNKFGFAKMYGIPTTSLERSKLALPDEDYLLQFVVFPGFDEDTLVDDSIALRYKYLEAYPHLKDVVTKSNIRFASIRNGHAKADFNITLPPALLSPRWRVLLRPILILGDSVSNMRSLLITGEKFAQKQDLDEINYENVLKSFADSSEYDSNPFFDHKRLAKDLKGLSRNYTKSYNDEWKRQSSYEKWKTEYETKKALNASQQVAEIEKKRQENEIKASQRVLQEFGEGVDTTGLYAQYLDEYNVGLDPEAIDLNPELTLDEVPKQYRDIFESGRTFDDIERNSITDMDSLLFAKYRYRFDEIALNEAAIIRDPSLYKELVKYPKGEYKDLYLDTIMAAGPETEFQYRFSQSYPVTPGMAYVRMAVGGKVEADDLSSYRMPGSDTLTYFFTDLSALVDSTLAYSEVKLFRSVYDEQSVMPKYRAGKSELEIDYMDNKAQVDSILTAYNKNRYERGLIIDSVILKAYSSLEGDYTLNLELSKKRSVGMKEYLKKVLPPDANVNEVFKAKYEGEDWSGLRDEVEKHPDIRFKSQILNLIDNAVYPDETERKIAQKFGVDYGIIYYDIYPRLRKIDVIFNMSRPYMGVADSVYRVVNNEYSLALEHMKKKNYMEALGILAAKGDFNTALCYASLDQFGKAYDVLKTLEPNTNVEYLLAISAYNIDKKEEAVQHLLNACNLDFRKIYRIPLDIEATNLMNEFELEDELKTILKENRAMGLENQESEDEEEDDLNPKTYNPDDDEKVGSKIDDGEFIIVN